MAKRTTEQPPAADHSSRIAEPLRHLAVPIDQLNRDPANARRHGERNLDAIKSSLAMFGQRKPIVVQREGMIVRAGNGTLLAARELGWTELACVVVDDDPSTAVQFAIADNRTSDLSSFDAPVLATLLEGYDEDQRAALGFDQKDMDAVLAGLQPLRPDEIVAAAAEEAPPEDKPEDDLGGAPGGPPPAKLQACCPKCGHVFDVGPKDGEGK